MSHLPMKLAIVTIASELEHPYIQEWIDYHKSIGITDFYIFANNTEFTINDESVNREAMIHLKNHYDGEKRQLDALNDGLELAIADKIDFSFFIDVDEFIKVRPSQEQPRIDTLQKVLARYEKYPAIAVNWRLFGSSDIESVDGEDYSVLTRFHRCAKNLNPHIKQCINTRLIGQICGSNKDAYPFFVNPHFTSLKWINLEKFKGTGPYNPFRLDHPHILEISHYITKSKEECRIRRTHPRSDTGKPREEGWEQFFNNHNINEIEESEVGYGQLFR